MRTRFSMESFGRNVRRMRFRRGLSQKELAAAAGCSRVYVSEIEKGHRNPSLEVGMELARALGVSLGHLISDPDEGMKCPSVM